MEQWWNDGQQGETREHKLQYPLVHHDSHIKAAGIQRDVSRWGAYAQQLWQGTAS
jgi:hypothetical protein